MKFDIRSQKLVEANSFKVLFKPDEFSDIRMLSLFWMSQPASYS